ncbi:MAG TPA: glycosyltransferase family 4 protein [Rhodopila sp.]|uniref:glycosyltransferase family 4 protein n=1 Tax=Rhodopila sp. TaxID=2480087 RepID=UPI002C34D445|nr:glycosyltransferase family 4 protein [Rhodopila sp.]HVY15190.1 glycosyltransferase family 4 protein [Rhodopila sp.]
MMSVTQVSLPDTPSISSQTQGPSGGSNGSPNGGQRRILFAKLGSFSHTNERLLEQLSSRFPAHDIVTFDVKTHVKREFGATGWNALLEVLTYGPSVMMNPSDRHAFFFFTPFMFRHLSRVIREKFAGEADRFDFVIQTQGLFNAALPGRPFVIYTDHTVASSEEYEIHDRRVLRCEEFLALETDMFRRADRILVSAGHVERTLVNRYRCDPDKVKTILIGANVEPAETDPSVERYATGRVVFVGIDWQRKGGPVLLSAFEKIADRFPHAELTILGCSPTTTHPRIRALGKRPRTEVAEHLSRAAIFCLPSLVEPSAVASVEAMAFRLPVVATQVGGFPEMVADGETGLLVPPNDPDALAAALASLLDAPARAQAMGQAGYDRFGRFSWDAVGARLQAEIGHLAR